MGVAGPSGRGPFGTPSRRVAPIARTPNASTRPVVAAGSRGAGSLGHRPLREWLMLPAAFRLGPGAERILGPRVLGVTSAEVFADLEIGVRPETAKVVGHLDGSVVRPEEVENHGDATAGNPWRLRPTEEFLEPGRQDRRPSRLVSELDAAAAWNRQRLGRMLVKPSSLNMREASSQEWQQRGPPNLVHGSLARADLVQQVGERWLVELRPIRV